MNLKKVIKDHGWTLQQLAEQMTNKEGKKGITQASVSQVINGNPTIDKLKEIASIIGISLEELISDGKYVMICPHCGKNIVIKTEKPIVEEKKEEND